MRRQPVGNAHLIAGGPEHVETVLEMLKNDGISVRGNPDIYVRTYRHFGIDEAREMRERAAARPLGPRRYFILVCPSMTSEAQNALLKTIEEPPVEAAFYIITPAPQTLLPTLRSRMQIADASDYTTEASGSGIDAREFLAAAPPKRLDMLKPLLQKGEDERRDSGAIVSFLSELEVALSGDFRKKMREDMPAMKQGIEALYRARAYAMDKGALVKPLLEQVALLCPQM
ncbi:MAG: hypothetical protein NUV59_03550 [Patescibacteria group bacterium]|nr:hypothetical protein [Patescibacteria group bacterium]